MTAHDGVPQAGKKTCRCCELMTAVVAIGAIGMTLLTIMLV